MQRPGQSLHRDLPAHLPLAQRTCEGVHLVAARQLDRLEAHCPFSHLSHPAAQVTWEGHPSALARHDPSPHLNALGALHLYWSGQVFQSDTQLPSDKQTTWPAGQVFGVLQSERAVVQRPDGQRNMPSAQVAGVARAEHAESVRAQVFPSGQAK